MQDVVSVRQARARLSIGTSTRAIGAALLLLGSQQALAQAAGVPDPAGSSSTVGNPNEAGSAEAQKAQNAAVTGDVTPAQNEATAQAAGQAAADAGAAPADQDIVVTGFRRSLENAVAEKKNRDQIVESISAEDIGKLPDASIAESIARLPGLTSQRVSGRSQVISIRGFAPDFSTTLLNGREQTSTGENRAVEYDQYPSEVVNQVLVYKSPMASIIGQGLSGTVDLRTIRPIEFGRRVFSVGARGSYTDLGKLNAGSEDLGYRVTGTYVDQFADDKVGLSLSASYIDEPYQIQEFNAWGYNSVPVNGQNAALIGGSKSYVTSTRLKRFGLAGTLEFRLHPNLTTTVDGFYSDFKDLQTKRGIELPLGFLSFGTTFAATPAPTVRDGVVTSGTFQNVRGVVRNDQRDVTAKLYSFAVNNAWKGDDGWNAQMDISFSKTDRSELSIESYAGTGFNGDETGQGAAATIGFTSGSKGTVFRPSLNYSDPATILLTDPLGWGGGTVSQPGYYNDRLVTDEIQQYRVEIEKEFENSFLSSWQIGGNYTYHQKTLEPDEAFIRLRNGVNSLALPAQYRQTSTNLSYLGLGPILSYNPLDLLRDGILVKEPRDLSSQDVLSKFYSVREDLMTLYTQLNIKASLGSAELTGNVGVQAVNTEQKSTGYTFTPTTRFQTRGDDYWDVMPSLNLSLRTASDFVFRVAASREVMRPRMVDMRQSLEYRVELAGGVPVLRGSSGNPNLRPYRANAIDASIEKYFGNRGYLALQGYYKDLKSYVYLNQEVPFDYSGFALPAGAIVPPTFIGTINTPVNVKGGSLYGAELAGTLPLTAVTGALDGFGLTGGVSYTKTSIAPSPGAPTEDLPGYSRWTANGTAFFEKWGFSARGSVRYRSTFQGEIVGFGGDRAPRRALGETIVDAQIGYDFSGGSALNGLSIFIQGQNLTDEPFRTVTNLDTPLQVIDYQSFGRRFLAGATFKF